MACNISFEIQHRLKSHNICLPRNWPLFSWFPAVKGEIESRDVCLDLTWGREIELTFKALCLSCVFSCACELDLAHENRTVNYIYKEHSSVGFNFMQNALPLKCRTIPDENHMLCFRSWSPAWNVFVVKQLHLETPYTSLISIDPPVNSGWFLQQRNEAFYFHSGMLVSMRTMSIFHMTSLKHHPGDGSCKHCGALNTRQVVLLFTVCSGHVPSLFFHMVQLL